MEDLEQLRVFIARQQAQLDQLQQQVQQQQVHQAQARQASPVGQEISELRSNLDTRVMEEIPIFDGNEAHFADVAVHFRGNVWALGFGRGFETVGLVDRRRSKPQRLRSTA